MTATLGRRDVRHCGPQLKRHRRRAAANLPTTSTVRAHRRLRLRWAVGSGCRSDFVFCGPSSTKLLALGYAPGSTAKTGAIDRFRQRGLDPRRLTHDRDPLGRDRDRSRASSKRLAGAALGRLAVHDRPPRHRVALMLGIGIRIAACERCPAPCSCGWPHSRWANNPFMDEHLIFAVILIGLAARTRR
jgi:hypothetical protein